MWKRWRDLLFQRSYHGQIQSALGRPRQEPVFTAQRMQQTVQSRELTRFDTSNDTNGQTHGSRNVVPRVASASFSGQSRQFRRLPNSTRSVIQVSCVRRIAVAGGGTDSPPSLITIQALQCKKRSNQVRRQFVNKKVWCWCSQKARCFGGKDSEADRH